MFDLTGRKALVTGATGGLGGAIARTLHAQGASVAISGTRTEALEALASELGERVFVVPCNLSDKESVEALVPAAEDKLGGLDILVNNAGITRDNLFMRLKDEDWDSVLAVNLTAAFRLTRAAVKSMMRKRYGRIVSDRFGRRHHGQSRPGQLCRRQGRPDRHVQGPGGRGREPQHHRQRRRAGLHRVSDDRRLNEKQREAILADVPMGRLGAGKDIAAAVAFLASEEAGYVTGQTLHVNGGMARI